MKAFISYSHRDAEALDRLHTHLSILRREGRIQEWFDREILGGDEVDSNITAALERSNLFLLLVSPDFLGSNYCYGREMAHALKRHNNGSAQVIPIIVEPCDWKSTSLVNLKALPRDGNPIALWQNKNSAYLDIVKEIRRIVDRFAVQPVETVNSEPEKPAVSPGYGKERNNDQSAARDLRIFTPPEGYVLIRTEGIDMEIRIPSPPTESQFRQRDFNDEPFEFFVPAFLNEQFAKVLVGGWQREGTDSDLPQSYVGMKGLREISVPEAGGGWKVVGAGVFVNLPNGLRTMNLVKGRVSCVPWDRGGEMILRISPESGNFSWEGSGGWPGLSGQASPHSSARRSQSMHLATSASS